MSLVALAPPAEAYDPLSSHLAVHSRGAVAPERCLRWADAVSAARDDWTSDFDGAQFCLGRAFYTHLETDRSDEYFADAADSDVRVERHVPGLQATMRELAARVVRGHVVQREGWCGAGVHVFPAGSEVARGGGVVHFDTEGLSDDHVARRAPALSLVLMLRPPSRGGGLRLWPALYAGRDTVDQATLRAGGDVVVFYEPGDLLVFDSYRCHQILPFSGAHDRISSTLHVAQVDRGSWESWF